MGHERQARIEPDFAGHTVWQVKASTLCNLRCKYCYEWDRLADRHRMAVEQWRHVFQAAADYQRLRRERNDVASYTVFAWHGGEASLHPPEYVEEVLALQTDVLGRNALADGRFINAIQTNLFRINKTLDLMIDRGFVLSTSLDYKPGGRVDAGGKDAETQVLKNLETLLGRGVPCGVALVLGRHNHRHLIEIHDHLEQIKAGWLHIIPMLDPPENAPSDNLQLTVEETLDALKTLYVHRLKTGSTFHVPNLNRVVETVGNYRQGKPSTWQKDRAIDGETRIVVHPDGIIAALAGSAEPPRVLGNIFDQTFHEIFNSPPYAASLADDAQKRSDHCGHCRYEQSCDQRPVMDGPVGGEKGPCKIHAKLCDFAEQMLS